MPLVIVMWWQPLWQLSLRGNSFGTEGAKPLADALRVNSGLTHLDVTYNQLGEDGRSVLSDAVKGRDGFTLKLKGEYERE